MTTPKPYELLARFAPDGTIAGVSVRTITTVNGRDYESDPQPLSGATDPAFVAFANQFAAAAVSQRDALEAQVTALTAERDSLQTQVDTIPGLTAQIETLQANKAALQTEVDRLTALVQPPLGPREISPREFLSRLSTEDKLAIWNSDDPRCAAAMWELFAATSINLDSPVLAGMIDMLIESGVPIDAEERARIFA